jgi:hypothetical protein
MAHAVIDNQTPFACATLFLANEEGQPLLVGVVKATYGINPHGLTVADKQLLVNPAGQYWGDPDASSYKYEPDAAFIKVATDVVLIGHAYAPRAGAAEVNVSFRVGPLEKTVRVVGDRTWVKGLLGASPSEPKPFERIPLLWERAYGGWDRTPEDPARHTFEPRNPVGVGIGQKNPDFAKALPVPNLEDPRKPIRHYGDTPPPAGFGFTGPSWQPRASFAGTYDENWTKTRMPLLPKDFDRRFFNAAAPGLIAPGYLQGSEPVVVQNAARTGTVSFSLPGVQAPQCLVTLVGRQDQTLKTQLDTVVVNLDENLLLLTWRTYLALRQGPHDVRALKVWAEGMPAPSRSPLP